MYHFLLKTVLSPEEFPDLHQRRRIEPDRRDFALEYTYFEILTACLVDLARTDREPGPQELDFLRHVLDLDANQARKLAERQGFLHYRRVFTYLTERQKMELFGLLLELAQADEQLDPAELDFLRKTMERLRLEPKHEANAQEQLRILVEKMS